MICHWLITKCFLRTLSDENVYHTPNNLPLKFPKIDFLPPSHSICLLSTAESLEPWLVTTTTKYKSKIYYISTISLLLLATDTATKECLKSYYQVEKLKDFYLPSISLPQKSNQAFWGRRVGQSTHFSTETENPNSSLGWLTLTKSLNLRTCFLTTISEVLSNSEISSDS